jgi:3-hydroxybutyryl-CoA dehydrogenase
MNNFKTIGICGIGQMGASASIAFKRAGYRVLLWARDPNKLRELGAGMADPPPKQTDAEADGPKAAGPPEGEIILEANLARLDAEADAVLECIIEVMEEKVALLKRLENCRRRRALLMSVTSGLSITEMGRRSATEALLVGAHFWNPPHLIPLVEMVAGPATPPAMFEAACELMRDVGKIPVRCKDVPGFIGNRLMHAMWREALALVDAGVCSVEDIDRVVKLTFALRLPVLGPMENMDLVGLDAAERVHTYLFPALAKNDAPARCLSDKVKAGELGMKSGQGFYDWRQRDANRTIADRDRQIARQLEFLREIGAL